MKRLIAVAMLVCLSVSVARAGIMDLPPVAPPPPDDPQPPTAAVVVEIAVETAETVLSVLP